MACHSVDQYYTAMEKHVKIVLAEKTGSVIEADAFIQV